VSLFDRLFGTFTPAERGMNVAYGLEGFDDPAVQTTAGLLAMPYRERRASTRPPSWATARLEAPGEGVRPGGTCRCRQRPGAWDRPARRLRVRWRCGARA